MVFAGIFLIVFSIFLVSSLTIGGKRVAEVHRLGNIEWYSSVDDMVCYKFKKVDPSFGLDSCPEYYALIEHGR